MKRKRTRLAAAAALTVMLTAACNVNGEGGWNERHGFRDAGVSKGNQEPAEVVNFPDGIPNVFMKCDGHGHRLYLTSDRWRPEVHDDPTCPGGPATR